MTNKEIKKIRQKSLVKSNELFGSYRYADFRSPDYERAKLNFLNGQAKWIQSR